MYVVYQTHVPRFPLFVLSWVITGTMATACYTSAFVWTMEMTAGKWRVFIGMSMMYSWPISRLIIAGLSHLYPWITKGGHQKNYLDREIVPILFEIGRVRG